MIAHLTLIIFILAFVEANLIENFENMMRTEMAQNYHRYRDHYAWLKYRKLTGHKSKMTKACLSAGHTNSRYKYRTEVTEYSRACSFGYKVEIEPDSERTLIYSDLDIMVDLITCLILQDGGQNPSTMYYIVPHPNVGNSSYLGVNFDDNTKKCTLPY